MIVIVILVLTVFTKKNVMRSVGRTKQTKAVATPVMYREESESWGASRSQ